MQEFAKESKNLRKYSNISSDISGSPEQMTAISLFTGPSQIIAGPGAGKTFVLVNHIDYLINHYHVDPYSILVLTFSKASALEMNERYLKMPKSSAGVSFGTFHSVFFHILKNSEHRKFNLIDGKRKLSLLKTLLSVYFPDTDESDISILSDIISSYKTDGTIRLCGHFDNRNSIYAAIRHYNSYLDDQGLVDFDDMILKCLYLLETRTDIRAAWQNRFRFILVDEFQDINMVQYRILLLLSQKEHNLFVVGDDDQSIYGFRGASPGIMQQFADDHRNTRRIFLTNNYRCKSQIVRTAGKVINENTDRIEKSITAVNITQKGEQNVKILSFPDSTHEYAYICDKLAKINYEKLKDNAVIFRTHLQAKHFCRYLKIRGIAFSGEKIEAVSSETEILKDILAYFKMAADLSKGAVLRSDYYRVMNRPDRFLGRESAGSHILTPELLLSCVPASSNAGQNISELLSDLKALYELPPSFSVKYLLYSMKYADWRIKNENPDDKSSLELIFSRLSASAAGTHSCEEFTAYIRHLIETNENNDKTGKNTAIQNGLRVMTMHAVKGLEFDHVFIPDLNEGIVPNKRAITSEQIEEERRLLYVAMTRARTQLEIMYLDGSRRNPRKPSRFLLPLGVKPWQN